MSTERGTGKVWEAVTGERGFTLLEVMVAIVLLTFGLLAVADVFPRGLALGLYGDDQTRAATLGQYEIECLKNQSPASLSAYVGEYGSGARTAGPCNPSGTATQTTYFDQNGGVTTQALAYYTRDLQVQYWTYSSTGQFIPQPPPATPYAPQPAAGSAYAYRISAAVHWLVRGQTAYSAAGPTVYGCVNGGVARATGLGCVQVSTFISPY